MGSAFLLNVDQLRSAIQEEYTEVASCPLQGFHFHTGRTLAGRLGYPEERVAALPDAVVESFAGVGNPFTWGEPAAGETVLDLGSGAGFDLLQAATMIGPTGHAIGVDMTPAMLEKARANADLLHLGNADFRQGYLEALPVGAETVDLVISNGVLNLCPDKAAVLIEAYRVLKPGGRLQLSDIVVARATPEDAKADVSLWTGCIAGALLESELRALIEEAGFVSVEVSPRRYDAFADAPSASSAAEFGTQGVDIRAVKPAGRKMTKPAARDLSAAASPAWAKVGETGQHAISPVCHKRLAIQGYGTYSAEQLTQLRPGIRFAYLLCAALAALGIALVSIPILATLLIIAFLGVILPNHPADYLYNYGVRHLFSRPALPPRTVQIRFACGLASLWLAATILLFWQGLVTIGIIWGSILVAIALLVGTTDICIPSMVFNLIRYKRITPWIEVRR